MRKSYITLLIAALLGMSSCQDYFLQKPMGNDVTAKEVFSSKQKAMSAIAQAYSEALRINITFLENDGSNLYGMTSGTLAHISGELNGFRYNWSDPVIISNSGMSASGPWIDNFTFNYTAIRRCYTVIENIGAVPDMSNEEKENVRGEYASLDNFIQQWSAQDKKEKIRDLLRERGIDLELMKAEQNMADVDDFDFICHVAFDKKPLTRKERANNVKKRDFLSRYSGVAREVLEALLDKYMNTGIYEIEKTEILKLDPFMKIGKPSKIAGYFGGKQGYLKAVQELEQAIYTDEVG